MHISVPSQSHTSTTGTMDDRISPPDATAPAVVRSYANPYAVALNGLADIYLEKARYMRSQEVDAGSPDNPKCSLAGADIRFLTHCGVKMDGQPIEEYNNAKGALSPLELERLAHEMQKRAAQIELESTTASLSRSYGAPAQRSFV